MDGVRFVVYRVCVHSVSVFHSYRGTQPVIAVVVVVVVVVVEREMNRRDVVTSCACVYAYHTYGGARGCVRRLDRSTVRGRGGVDERRRMRA